MTKYQETNLPLNTPVEVVAFKGGMAVDKKNMTYKEALELKKTKGFTYRIFEKDFSQFKIEK